jgi:hypothetical protein
MAVVGTLAGLALIVVILLDGFEAMVLPRRVTRALRPARFFYRNTWEAWRLAARLVPGRRRRETFLSLYGPLSLLTLFGLWALALITAFALLSWSWQTSSREGEVVGFLDHLYLSGVTFFTLGYGDITPVTRAGRVLAVLEGGLGFGFMAVIIGYLPVLYQAFSGREVTISLLDARAGSPPSAAQMLVRLGHARAPSALEPLLAEWERWAARLLESHLSFPVLGYYRSQHDNQSWLGALTVILDTCSLLLAGVKGVDLYQVQLTFGMARHAAVDIALVFHTPPRPETDRLPPEELRRLREQLREAGLPLPEGAAADAKLTELRGMYEPFVQALARHFRLVLPPFVPEKQTVDNWQTSAWMRRAPGFGKLQITDGDDHFD